MRRKLNFFPPLSNYFIQSKKPAVYLPTKDFPSDQGEYTEPGTKYLYRAFAGYGEAVRYSKCTCVPVISDMYTERIVGTGTYM